MLSAACLRQQNISQPGDLFRGRVPKEQTWFEHFQFDHAPAVFWVPQQVNPSVSPPTRGDGHGSMGDVQDLWRGLPRLVFRTKIILNPKCTFF